MKTQDRILILDGHTNQALACVRSLGEAGYAVLVASHERFPLAAWSRHCRGSFRLAGQSVEAFAALREWAERERVHIVLPLTERACALCNDERAQWEAAGMTVGCAPDDMLLSAFDKALTLSCAAACGVSIPRTRFPRSLEECLAAVDELGFPCVVKPRRSNAREGGLFATAKAPAYVNQAADLAKVMEARRQGADWPLVQEFVRGQGKGVFALCDRGRVVAWFAHERLRDTQPTGSGSSLRRSVSLEGRLREPSERLLGELKWHGPAMVEFKDDGINPPCLMEINGRFWGSLQLGIDSGVNFPLLWISILKGEPVEPLIRYTEGVTLRWLWGDVKRFLHILGGAPQGYPGAYPSVLEGVKELLGPQPAGTRLEMWRRSDPWPSIGEWVGGIEELLAGLRQRATERAAEQRLSIDKVMGEI